MNKFVNQTKLLSYLGIEPKTNVYFTAISKLSKLRNGFNHKQKYKTGVFEKHYEPQLKVDIDFIHKNNRVFYNLDSIDLIKSLMINYIQIEDVKKEYLGRAKKESVKKKIYGKEYKKIS
jgi:hypothetical protein